MSTSSKFCFFTGTLNQSPGSSPSLRGEDHLPSGFGAVKVYAGEPWEAEGLPGPVWNHGASPNHRAPIHAGGLPRPRRKSRTTWCSIQERNHLTKNQSAIVKSKILQSTPVTGAWPLTSLEHVIRETFLNRNNKLHIFETSLCLSFFSKTGFCVIEDYLPQLNSDLHRHNSVYIILHSQGRCDSCSFQNEIQIYDFNTNAVTYKRLRCIKG